MLTSALPKCALVALHVIAEEGRGGEDGCTPDLANEWKLNCPKSQMWEIEDAQWSEDKVCLQMTLERAMCNEALRVIGLYGPGDKISLFLKDWELAKVALSCHMVMLCQENP